MRKMKKTYLQPKMLPTQVDINLLICVGSPNKNTPTEGLDDDLVDGGDDPGDFSRRRNSVWNEQEENEW